MNPSATTRKTPGIIGGIGPEATADLFQKVTEHTPADTDQDHLHILVHSNPQIPSRFEAVMEGGPSPGPELVNTAHHLESMGADFLAIASNLTHHYYADVQDAVDLPVLNLIESTATWVSTQYDVEAAGILAPTPTIQVELFEAPLRRAGVRPVTLRPEENQRLVDESIYGETGIKSGHIERNRDPLERAAGTLVERGAEVLILGCTELPLVFSGESQETAHDYVDTNAVLAKRIVEEAVGEPLFGFSG